MTVKMPICSDYLLGRLWLGLLLLKLLLWLPRC
jgi:hypothetical protein